jgi:ankyrin repeat protein
MTALHLASSLGNLDLVNSLLDASAELDVSARVYQPSLALLPHKRSSKGILKATI